MHQRQTTEHSERVRQLNIANGAVGKHPSQLKHNKAAHISRQTLLHAEGKHSSQKQENRDFLSVRMTNAHAIGKHLMQNPENCKAASLRATAMNNELVAKGEHPWQAEEYKETQSNRMTIRNTENVKVGEHPMQKPENCKAQAERSRVLWTRANPMHKQENKAAASLLAKIQVVCPWCGKTGNKPPMHAHHFDKCLEHPENLGLARKQIKEKLSNE